MTKNVTGGILLLLGGAGLISLFATKKGQEILTIIKGPTAATKTIEPSTAAEIATPKINFPATPTLFDFSKVFGYAGEKAASQP